MPSADSATPSLSTLLEAAITAIGGTPREGQRAMAEAVGTAMEGGRHLLVQAGTGTGKSLAYLVPALLHAVTSDRPSGTGGTTTPSRYPRSVPALGLADARWP